MSSQTSSSQSVKDFKLEENTGSSGRKPAIAEKLEAESRELLEKRQSLTKEAIVEKLEAAGEKRQEILDAKINLAKELEGGKKHETQQQAMAGTQTPPKQRE